MEAIQSFEAESSETGNSRKTLSRYGMVRATLQPEFGALTPERAVVVLSVETGAPAEETPAGARRIGVLSRVVGSDDRVDDGEDDPAAGRQARAAGAQHLAEGLDVVQG